MKVTTDDLVADPAWIPIRINAEFTELKFIHLPRERHSEVTFLQEDFLPANVPMVVAPFAAIHSASRSLNKRPAFILHSSMAASTLLTRAFNCPGTSMSLSEPIVLNELAAMKRRRIDVRMPLETILKLLGRPFGKGEKTVVKPGNNVNVLAPVIHGIDRDFRAIAIHAPLRAYLRSIVKKGMIGRIVYRRLYALLVRDRTLDTGFTPEDVFEQTDMQIAAMCWLMHHSEFHDYLGAFPDNIRSLNSDDLLADTKTGLAAIANHLGVDLPVDKVFDSGVFDRHSKMKGRSFSIEERAAEHARAEEVFGGELDMVVGWLTSVAEHVRVDLRLPNPLPGVKAEASPI